MSSNFQGPTWLREDASYNEYIRLGEKGELNFPEYEKDDEGRIIFHYGEAFCRWPECDRRMKRQEARDLRTHVKTHVGVSMLKPVAHPQFGKVRTQAKDQIRCKPDLNPLCINLSSQPQLMILKNQDRKLRVAWLCH